MTENSEAADLGKSMSLPSSLAMHQSNVGIENPGAVMAFCWPWQRDKRPPEPPRPQPRPGWDRGPRPQPRPEPRPQPRPEWDKGPQPRPPIKRKDPPRPQPGDRPGPRPGDRGPVCLQDHGGKQLGIDD